jgi:hypothetical protein
MIRKFLLLIFSDVLIPSLEAINGQKRILLFELCNHDIPKSGSLQKALLRKKGFFNLSIEYIFSDEKNKIITTLELPTWEY